jgi:hypothetical protein
MLLKGVDKELFREGLGLKVTGDRFMVLTAIEHLRKYSAKYQTPITQGKLPDFISNYTR